MQIHFVARAHASQWPDIDTLDDKATLRGHNGTVRGLAVAPGGTMLASAGEDNLLRMWNAAGTNAGKP